MVCGIYKIVNDDNGKIYVGSSKDINKRWEQHLRELNTGKHHSAKLQHAWNKSGNKLNLSFHVLEECSQDELFVREQVWMDLLEAYEKGYNCSKSAICPTNKIKASLTVKYEKELNEICELLYQLESMRDVFPKDIQVSFFGLKAGSASTDSAFIKRYIKALKMCIRIVEHGEYLDPTVEYRLHNIHYIGKEAEYTFSPEYNTSKNAKYSLHNKVKAGDLYSRLWEDVYENVCGKIVKEIKKRYSTYKQSVGEAV